MTTRNPYRRGVIAGLAAAALAAPALATAADTEIVAAMRKLHAISVLALAVDMADDDDERDRLHHEMRPIVLAVLAATPTTTEDAALLLMLATAEIGYGNAIEKGNGIIERGEFAVRRVVRFLADSSRLNLKHFAGDHFFGGRNRPFYEWPSD